MSKHIKSLLFALIIGIFAITLGSIAASGPIEALMIVFGLSLAFAMLAIEPIKVVWVLMIAILLIVGQIVYFANIKQAYWLPYLMLIPIALRAVLADKSYSLSQKYRRQSLMPLLFFMYFLTFAISAAINSTPFALTMVAVKNYILPWFFSLFILRFFSTPDELRQIWRFLLIVVCIQPAFVIPQNLIFAKMRGDDVGWDSVVGSFGGEMLGGGNSGAMAVYIVFGLILAMSLYRRECISGRFLIAIISSAVISIALAEVKIFFMLLPIGVALLFRTEFIKKPLHAFGALIVTLTIIFGLGVTYSSNYSDSIAGTDTFEGMIEYALFAEGDAYFFNPITREVSRIGALMLWAQANGFDSIITYVGQGPFSSRESQTLGDGIAQMQHGFSLGTSTASSMLWEVGVIGLSFLLSILFAAGSLGLALSKQGKGFEAAALESSGVMLLLGIPLLFYNRDLIDTPAIQILVSYWVGYILLCNNIFNKLTLSAGTK